MNLSDNNILETELWEDGSEPDPIFEEFSEESEESEVIENSFYANLAVDMSKASKAKLSSYLLDAIDEDIESRKPWMEVAEEGKKLLGFSIEDRGEKPFKFATRTYDATFPTAVLRFYATIRAELLPQSGPAGYRISGDTGNLLEQQARKNRDYLNYYLTIKDKGYYPDFEKLLMYLGVYGSCFKKVYYDPLLKGALSRFITPEDFIIDNDCTSIMESNRITHVLHLSKREILLNQQSGIYDDIDLPYLNSLDQEEHDENEDSKANDDVNLEAYTKRSLFPIYEIHTYICLDEFLNDSNIELDKYQTIPVPYVVTIDKTSKKILSIRRNWKEEDETKAKINFFVQYNYLPGFGVLGLGLSHVLGSNAKSLTRSLRSLIDAAAFKNFPGGIKSASLTTGQSNKDEELIAGPGQFVSVNNIGPLSENFMTFPFSGADPTLLQLMEILKSDTKELGSISELGMLESREDIPTGTVVAMLENSNRIQSAVFRSIHNSFSQELQLIDSLIRDTLEVERFEYNGHDQEITSEDFIDEVKIIPISDPSVNSNAQRIIKAESMLATAKEFPDLYNMREVNKLYFQAQGVDEKTIDVILKPEAPEETIPSVDPISEVFNILLGKPVKASISQNHPAHILCLGAASKRPEFQGNEQAMGALQALITEHQALQYVIEMQQMLGVELPSLDQIQDPEIQNTIAMALAQKLEESGTMQEDEQVPILDPLVVAQHEIDQKREESAIKERIATQRAEVDIEKARLNAEIQKAKIESNEDIALLKSETELTKQGVLYE